MAEKALHRFRQPGDAVQQSRSPVNLGDGKAQFIEGFDEHPVHSCQSAPIDGAHDEMPDEGWLGNPVKAARESPPGSAAQKDVLHRRAPAEPLLTAAFVPTISRYG